MSEAVLPPRGFARELGRFLEFQNIGLNLPLAIAFLLVAARGFPNAWTTVLVVVAFVAARNAGHSFNRWADLALDRANPRTQDRALVTGRFSPRFAIALTLLSGAILGVAAFLLNPVAFALAPVALFLILGYSYTKRMGWWTTPFLGIVEAITPAAAYVAVRATLPPEAFLAVVGVLLWGTAFETLHSLGDLASDRRLGLSSIPVRFGTVTSIRLLPLLHAGALGAFAAYGVLSGLPFTFDIALVLMALLAARIDMAVRRNPEKVGGAFRIHMALGAVLLAGVVVAVFLPGLLVFP